MDCSHFFTHILFHTRPLSLPHFAQSADKTLRSLWTAPTSLPISCFIPAPYLRHTLHNLQTKHRDLVGLLPFLYPYLVSHPPPISAQSHKELCPITQRTVPNHTKNCAQSHRELCPITQRTVPNHSEYCAQSQRVLCPITQSTVNHSLRELCPSTQRTVPNHTENCAQSHRVL